MSSILFGGSIALLRHAVSVVPPLTLAAVRFAQGGIILLASYRFVFSRRPIQVTRQQGLRLAVLGAVFFALYPAALNGALRLTTASRVSLVIATTPVWGALVSRVIRGTRLSGWQVTGLTLSLFGVAVMVCTSSGLGATMTGLELAGLALALVAALCGAVYAFLLPAALRSHGPVVVAGIGMIIGATLLLPLAVGELAVSDPVSLDASTVLQVVLLGVVGGAVSFALWAFSFDRLPLPAALLYGNLIPIVAATAGVVFLGEPMTAGLVVGFMLVSSGVLVVVRRPPASRRNG